MDHDSHSARCQDILGRPWPEVHKFMDQYFEVAPGEAHRIVLHHALGVNLCSQALGEASRPAAEPHVMDDMGSIPVGPQEARDMLGTIHPNELNRANVVLKSLGLHQVDGGVADHVWWALRILVER